MSTAPALQEHLQEPTLRPFRLTPAVTLLQLRRTLTTPSGRVLHARTYPRDMQVTERPAIRVKVSWFRAPDGGKCRFEGPFEWVSILLTWAECLPVTESER